MFTALRVGLTGLRANQKYLDVIGNNLTNSETFGFKADRVTFSDVLYQTSRAPTGPTGSLGGVNGRQTGFGTQVSSVDQLHSQGTLVSTGRVFDLAIQGRGFFVVNNGSEDYFSRAGTFTLDRAGSLVDSRTGYKVQSTSGSDIVIDTQQVAAAKATENITFAGNLPAVVTGPLAEIQETAAAFENHQPAILATTLTGTNTVNVAGQDLILNIDGAAPVTITFAASSTSQSPSAVATEINSLLAAQNVSPSLTASVDASGALVLTSDTTGASAVISASGAAATTLGINGSQASGSEATADAATDLNDLSANTTDYVSGDIIQLTGIDAAGQSVNVSFTYGVDGTTLGALTSKLDSAFAGTTFALVNGKIQGTNDATGESDLSVFINDATTSTGATAWSNHAFDATVEGSKPDTRATSITVFDSLGISHTLSGVFERQDDGTWNLQLSVPSDEGTIASSPITGIDFDNEGRFLGAAATTFSIGWSNGAASQTVTLDFGTIGGLDGLTQFGSESSAQAISQDGFESGTLASLGVTQGGVVQGFFSNGAVIDLDTIAIATFQNREGLFKEGSTLFRRSDNSGIALIGEAGTGGAGGIVSGALEGSNVDTAEEFVRLIEAQRSFQSSARVVTTADQLFAELLQVI